MASLLRGIDHIYLSVSDFERSEAFYDRLMEALGLHKGDKAIAGERHAHYLAPTFQLTIRPAGRPAGRPATSAVVHDPYAPGLHHLCFQTNSRDDVDACYVILGELGIPASAPRLYPEYNAEYYATFFEDPDGIRLEIVNRTSYRQRLQDHWPDLEG
ncbi:VOC family protein, partial [Limnoraphis robusta CCNP1324]|uniref:VOC family protein n=1 Tax=Limnoraphis robusta TaxID=1118279 RepID=UPI002B220488